VAEHLTEEEQIEAIKRWWSEYWKSIVVPIVLVAVCYSGWNIWQTQKEATAEAASIQYNLLVESIESAPGVDLTPEQKATARVLATEIVNDFEGSLYSDQANLILARLAVDAGEHTEAQNYLQAVTNGGANNAVKALATSRLARIKVALGEYDAAISLLSSAKGTKFRSLYAEIRGDAMAAQGKADLARTAFQEALDSLPARQFNRRSILQLKIDGAAIIAGAGADASEEDSVKDIEPPPPTEPESENSMESS